MFSVKNEEDLESSDQLGMRFKLPFIESIQHEQEIFNVAHMFVGDVVLSSNSMPVRISSDGWSYTQHTINLFIPELLVLVNLFTSKSRVSLRL